MCRTTADKLIPVTYSASGVGRNESVVLQRQEAASHSWRTVRHLSSAGHTSTAPALGVGIYRLRLAVLRHGSVVSQVQEPVRVFGYVEFDSLFAGDNLGDGGPGVAQGDGFAESYDVLFIGTPDSPTIDAFTVGSDNPCRAVAVNFFPSEQFNSGQGSGIGSIVQAAGVTQASSAAGRPKRLKATLTPGVSWGLQLQAVGNVFDWYIEGVADCDAPHIALTAGG
jgi:hypothetical protein